MVKRDSSPESKILKVKTIFIRIRFVIVDFSPEGVIAKKGFDEKSVVARVGQPGVLQTINLSKSVTDLYYPYYLANLRRKVKKINCESESDHSTWQNLNSHYRHLPSCRLVQLYCEM